MITIAHEGGHAVAALASGRRLARIRLHSDTSGLTVTSGRPRGLGMVITLCAGYITPSLLGLGGSWLLVSELYGVVLVCAMALLAGMVLAIRNLFGFLSVGVCGAITLAVLLYGTSTVQASGASILTWFLLLGSSRAVWELRHDWRRGQGPTSDADQLAALTHVPAVIWVGLFAVISLGALGVGGRWLLLTPR